MTEPAVRVWDLPVRLFHWSLVLLVPALWWTAETERMDVHILLGELMLGLILFRLFWGLFGSSTARFGSFVKGPAAVFRYLREKGRAFGHSPVGGWSVVAMLLALLVQVGLGLFSSDEDGIAYGPLASTDLDAAHDIAELHESFFWAIVALIALHLLAILYYLLVRRDNLVTPMVTGRGRPGPAGEAMVPAPLWRFLLAAGLAAGLTVGITTFL